jgi:hypothetical protein
MVKSEKEYFYCNKSNGFTDNIKSFNFLYLILEKIPFIIFSVISVFISIFSAKYNENVISTESISLLLRISNALVVYITYLYKIIFPYKLAIFYPFPEIVPVWKAIVSGLILLMITALVFLLRKHRPYLLIGWLWYCGTLLPMSGLVQAGVWPAMADRYAYIPMIGFFIMISWSIFNTTLSRWYKSKFIVVFTIIVFMIYFALT